MRFAAAAGVSGHTLSADLRARPRPEHFGVLVQMCLLVLLVLMTSGGKLHYLLWVHLSGRCMLINMLLVHVKIAHKAA